MTKYSGNKKIPFDGFAKCLSSKKLLSFFFKERSTDRVPSPTRKCLLFLSFCLISGNGFGSLILYLIAFGIGFSLYCIESFEKNRISLLLPSTYLLLVFIEPSFAQATSLIAIILLLGKKELIAAALLASQLLLLVSPIFPFPGYILSPYLSCLIFILFYFCLKYIKYRTFFIYLTLVLYGVFLLINTFLSWQIPVVKNHDTSYGHQIGQAVEYIIGTPQSGEGMLIINKEEYQETPPGKTIYLDHDAHTQWDSGNFYQKRPWGKNLLLASEPIRLATQRDGILISNLGACLKKESTHCIYAFVENGEVVPLLLNNKGLLVIADSDYLTNGMAPYQENLIKRLTGTDPLFIVFHLSSSIVLILFPIFSKVWEPGILFILYFLASWWPLEGDVRYVGNKHHWPHTDLGEGVVRVMQDAGFNVKFGSLKTKVLVVGAKHMAVLRKERLVILEPLASVRIGKEIYKADTLPLGTKEGVVDARKIFRGEEKLPPIHKTAEGIMIISTGTPAYIDFSSYYQ